MSDAGSSAGHGPEAVEMRRPDPHDELTWHPIPRIVVTGSEGSMGFETMHVAVPGGEIFATRRGVGEGPPALLLHGGPGIGAEQLVGLEPSTLVGPRDKWCALFPTIPPRYG